MFKLLTILSLICAFSGVAKAIPFDGCPGGTVNTLQGCVDAVIIGQSVEFHPTNLCPGNLLTEVNTARCYSKEDPFVEARKYYLHKMIGEFQSAKPQSEAMAAHQERKLMEYQKELRNIR
jgi:hypothetical protein